MKHRCVDDRALELVASADFRQGHQKVEKAGEGLLSENFAF